MGDDGETVWPKQDWRSPQSADFELIGAEMVFK